MAGMAIIIDGANFAATGWTASGADPVADFITGASQAFLFDPSVMSSMWQDRAMTTPVTASGQPVRAMSDRSGKGQHAILDAAATGTPTWQSSGGRYWVDIPTGADFQVSNPLTGAMSWSAIIAARITGGTSATERCLFCQLGASASSYLALQAGQRSGLQGVNLTSAAGYELTGAAIADGTDYVLGFRRDNSTLTAALRKDGVAGASVSFVAPSMASQPTTLIFGTGASNAVTQTTAGRLYYAVFVQAAKTDSDFAAIEAVIKAKAGVA